MISEAQKKAIKEQFPWINKLVDVGYQDLHVEVHFMDEQTFLKNKMLGKFTLVSKEGILIKEVGKKRNQKPFNLFSPSTWIRTLSVNENIAESILSTPSAKYVFCTFVEGSGFEERTINIIYKKPKEYSSWVSAAHQALKNNTDRQKKEYEEAKQQLIE